MKALKFSDFLTRTPQYKANLSNQALVKKILKKHNVRFSKASVDFDRNCFVISCSISHWTDRPSKWFYQISKSVIGLLEFILSQNKIQDPSVEAEE
jgi:hypothetical protein